MMQMVQECPQCGTNTKCRRRDFNEQSWAVLVSWGEVEPEAVDQPICESCYSDLREILIDRAGEFEQALKSPKPLQAPPSRQKIVAKKEATPKKKVVAAKSKKTSRVA